MKATESDQILRVQKLYKDFSRLSLAYPQDRIAALAPLQEGLLQSSSLWGGFGIADIRKGQMLCRTLLWCRALDMRSLHPIDLASKGIHSHATSWYWLACSGGVTYIDLSASEYEWADLGTPRSKAEHSCDLHPQLDIALTATVHTCQLNATSDVYVRIIMDAPDNEFARHGSVAETTCKIVARENSDRPVPARRHYVLIVRPGRSTAIDSADDRETCERVGAGFVPGHYLSKILGRFEIW